MVAGPGVLIVVTVVLAVVIVAGWRLRGARGVVRRGAPAHVSPHARPVRREAAVQEARRRLEQRVLEAPLATSDLVVPRQRALGGR